MHGDFRRLVHPASSTSEIDVEATRAARQAVREELRLRQHLVELLGRSVPGDGILSISAFTVLEGDGDSEAGDGRDDAA